MSSLSAARADGFYHPPDWDPHKGTQQNKQFGKHHLGARAKKSGQGILVIRFEMPFNVWCEKCNHHIGKGVRYNAEKKAVGKYHSTTIWEFSMLCHLCSGKIVIRTDPQKCDYICTSGCRKKVEDVEEDDLEDAGQQALPSTEEKAKRESDPFYKLEHATAPDEDVRREERPRIFELKRLRDERQDDGGLNRLLRKRFREEKKALAVSSAATEADRRRLNLDIPLLEAAEEDKHVAAAVNFRGHDPYKLNQRRRAAILSAPILPSSQKRLAKLASPAALACVAQAQKQREMRARALKLKHKMGMDVHTVRKTVAAKPRGDVGHSKVAKVQPKPTSSAMDALSGYTST